MEVIPFTAKIPANTTTAVELGRIHVPAGRILLVYVSIPSGWEFSAGFRIVNESGSPVLPSPYFGADAWITGDDDHYRLIVNKEIDNEQDLIVQGINNTAYDQPFTLIIIYMVKRGDA